ncbi:MAG: hypothetical protein OEX18_14190 [Candidatus Krumholzibacteria bacterium]|nr:hypothetical protein [Candidatus Krumholzibacteria bacterium]
MRTRNTFIVIVCVLAAVGLLGCGSSKLNPERISGTERYFPYLGEWISVSPGEQFLIFAEVDSTLPPPPYRGEFPSDFHLVTFDLRTGAKTNHVLDDIPSDALTDYKSNPWLGIIYSFDPVGWNGGTFGIKCRDWRQRPWVVFIPGVPEARVETRPESVGCSDCPPQGAVTKLSQSRGVALNMEQPGRFSAAWRNGKLSDDLYMSRRHGDDLEFVRVGSDRKQKKVAKAGRFFSETGYYQTRVSPDERYLAYAVIFRFKVPIPTGGVVELFIRDMEKRRTYQVDGVYLGVSNLNWSHDSRTLFFGASSVDENGVYRVTLPD